MVNKSEAGFTLIELLLVITILAIISGAIYSSNLSALRSWDFNRNRIDLKQNARIVILNLVRDLRNANSISLDGDGFANQDSLELADGKNLVISLSNDQEVEYLLANRELSKGNRVLTATTVDKLTLSKADDNDRLIEIHLELSHNNQAKTITEQVYLRAINW